MLSEIFLAMVLLFEFVSASIFGMFHVEDQVLRCPFPPESEQNGTTKDTMINAP